MYPQIIVKIMQILFFLLQTNYSFSQSVNPVCVTDSCKKKFLSYTINHGSFPMECVLIKFKDKSENKWSEVVYVVSIHNYYYYSVDSVNTKKYIDFVYQAICNGDYILKDTSVDKMFGGYRLKENVYNQMKSMPVDKFLYKYFDREGNVLMKYRNHTTEVLAVCFSYNITFLLAEYYYPAIHDATWDELCKYYTQLKNLPRPLKSRYY